MLTTRVTFEFDGDAMPHALVIDLHHADPAPDALLAARAAFAAASMYADPVEPTALKLVSVEPLSRGAWVASRINVPEGSR